MDFKKTETRINLMKAFAGESQARNRYSMWAKVALKEDLPQISNVFIETADHERVHAKQFYNAIIKEGGVTEIEITGAFPAFNGDTLDNLKAAAAGEHEENSLLYPQWANTAKEEGLSGVSTLFKSIAKAEEYHENRFNDLISQLEAGTYSKKDDRVMWKCSVCGYISTGVQAPENCPACDHDRKYAHLFLEGLYL